MLVRPRPGRGREAPAALGSLLLDSPPDSSAMTQACPGACRCAFQTGGVACSTLLPRESRLQVTRGVMPHVGGEPQGPGRAARSSC